MPQVMMPKPPEKAEPPEVTRQPDLPRQLEPTKQPEAPRHTGNWPEARKASENGFLLRCCKHWKGMSVFARIMFVMGVYGTAAYGFGIVLGLMAERGTTGNAVPLWFFLAAFLLNVRNLFCLFHFEGVGYYGIYPAALSLKPGWVVGLAVQFLAACGMMIYWWLMLMVVSPIAVLERMSYMDDNILTEIVAVGMLAFGAFNFIWPAWRCRTCNEIYYHPKKRKK